MNLYSKIQLINDLIAENRESTVRTYVESVKEIEAIEKASVNVIVAPVEELNNLSRSLIREETKRARA